MRAAIILPFGNLLQRNQTWAQTGFRKIPGGAGGQAVQYINIGVGCQVTRRIALFFQCYKKTLAPHSQQFRDDLRHPQPIGIGFYNSGCLGHAGFVAHGFIISAQCGEVDRHLRAVG